MTSETLESFLDTILWTIKRKGVPVGPPVMFAGDRNDQTHVALLAGEPLASAQAMIRKTRPTKIVVVSVSTDNKWLAFHAEATQPVQEIDRVYELPGWTLTSTDVQNFTFNNLLGVRN